MFRSEIHHKIHFYLSCFFVFSIPMQMRMAPLTLAAIALNWLLSFEYRESFRFLKENSIGKIFLGIYGITALGLIYSTDFGRTLFDLEVKIAFLGMPILFAVPFQKKQLNNVILSFVFGVLAQTFIVFGIALNTYLATNDTSVLFYTSLSNWIHPGYLANYLNFILILLIYYISQHIKSLSKLTLSCLTFLVLWVVLFIVLLLARTAWLVLITTLIWGGYYFAFKLKYYKSVAFIFLLISVVGTIALLKSPAAIQRLQFILIELKAFTKPASSHNITDTTSRSYLWESALYIIKDNWIYGVSSGDVRDLLVIEYEKINLLKAVKLKLNAHNQYLQSTLASGVLGLLLLLGLVVISFIKSIKSRDVIYFFFTLNLAIFMLFESALELQHGVLFYTFFSVILYQQKKPFLNSYPSNKLS